MLRIVIIILNWNGLKDTLECLKSMEGMATGGWGIEKVVVDNGSADGSIGQIRKQFPEIKILENQQNLGFAEGNNVGIRYALKNDVDYILLLNNDTLVNKSLLVELLRSMEKDRKIGIAGPKIYFASGFEYHNDCYKKEERGRVLWYAGGMIDWQNIYASHRGVDEVDHGQYEDEEETDFVSGCAMMIRRDVLRKIGLFDPKYYLYWEDNDFCQRAKEAGYKIMYIPKAALWHKNAISSQKPGSKLHQYYQTRNRLLFGFKYASWRSKLALVRESVKFLWQGGIRQKAIIDFYFWRMGKKNDF